MSILEHEKNEIKFEIKTMNLSRVIPLSAVIVFLLTLAGCAGGGVEINTGPAATTTANVNPTKKPVAIPTNRPVVIPIPIEDRWSDEFGDVIERQNIAMTEPVLALLEVYGCETQKTCESSLRSLPSGLGPAIEYLQTEIANLESLTPPARFKALHNSYLETTKLRLESFELYVAGVQNNDDTLLEAGDAIFERAQSNNSETLSLIMEFAREEGDSSPGVAWLLEFGSIQQEFLQYEAQIAPVIESFFYCETVEACEFALAQTEIPSTFLPGRDRLAKFLVTLENLDPPVGLSACSQMRDMYVRVYGLRLDAWLLLIRSAEENDLDLLDEGIRIYTQSMDIGPNELASNQACSQSIK